MTTTNASSSSAHSSGNGKAYIIILLGLLAHAFTAPMVKIANFEPFTSVILRCGIGALCMLPFAFHEIKKLGALNKMGIVYSIVAGLFLGIDFCCFNLSIFYAGAGIASILLNIQVIVLPALAFIFDREKIEKSYYIVAPIMIIGVAMSGGLFDPPAPPVPGAPESVFGMDVTLFGTLTGALSGFCYGFYLYFARKASRINHGQFLQPMTLSSIAQLVAPVIAIVLLSHDRGFDVVHGMMANGLVPAQGVGTDITAMNWVFAILLGSVGQAVVWTFIQYGSMRLEPTHVAGLLLLSPVATLAISFGLFHEVPSMLQLLGAVIVLLAVSYQNGLLKKVLPGKSAA
ncbi:DMT family transporter [Collinsella sp. AGMB00827]|uniref:DMT family transporter n=1 Tax=Collinsella ureilytica TaxID=2869515 RepID=A0ABS7MHL4_9ACTN|nr:DMT family transporter [Collinsella urealyticum]MBY4796857.1 DMT family transporter [Collinsella urealyticum]